MNKFLLVLAATLSFSVMAGGDSGVERSASFGVNVSSKSESRTSGIKPVIKEIEAGEVKLKRRQVTKLKRGEAAQLAKMSSPTVYRASAPQTSSRSDAFEFYDAWTSLDFDADGDGYFSDFSVGFDADFLDGSADVFAEVYLSRAGGAWALVHTSEVFSIYSNDSDDAYEVLISLNRNFATAEYDVLIDLYEAGYAGTVATVTPQQDADLYALPLEDYEHELVDDATLITYVASELAFDEDRDGFYTRLTLEYDIDTYDAGRLVYAEIKLTDSDTLQRRTMFTGDFVLGNQTEFIDIDFTVDYPAAWYDVEILLIDAYSEETLAIAAQDFSSLIQLPIESQDYDWVTEEVWVDSHASGGGSLGVLLLIGVAAIGLRRSDELTLKQ